METLTEMNWVEKSRTFGVNADLLYNLSGEPLASYLKFKESRK